MNNLPDRWLILNENKDRRFQEKVIPYINRCNDSFDCYIGTYEQYYGMSHDEPKRMSRLNTPPKEFTILTVDEFIELTEHQNNIYELW